MGDKSDFQECLTKGSGVLQECPRREFLSRLCDQSGLQEFLARVSYKKLQEDSCVKCEYKSIETTMDATVSSQRDLQLDTAREFGCKDVPLVMQHLKHLLVFEVSTCDLVFKSRNSQVSQIRSL